jgi:Zn-dependent protease with chaperone function
MLLLAFVGYSHSIYGSFIRNALEHFVRTLPDTAKIVHERLHPHDQREVTDWKLFLFCACALLWWPAYRFLTGWSTPLQKTLFLVCMLPALLLLAVVIHSLKGSLGSVKVTALVNNLVPALGAIALLFIFPALLDYVMNNVVLFVMAAPRPLTVLAELAVCHSLFCIFVLINVVGLGYGAAYEFTGKESQRQRRIEFLFWSKNHKSKEGLTANVSPPLRIIVWAIFLILSVTMWIGLLQNFSILVAFFLPDMPSIHFGWGKTIHDGITILGNPVSSLREVPGQYLSILLMGPPLVIFSFFVILNIVAIVQYWRKWRSFVPLTNELAAMAQAIAREMNVPKVHCVIDQSSLVPSPSAKVAGWWPKNFVIFTKGSLKFLADHQEYAEVIIAHEIGHLERDSRRLWKYGILSRLGLVGTAFLSVLVDSVRMEDYGDYFALRYLSQKEISIHQADALTQPATENQESVSLLKDAAHAIEACEYLQCANGPPGMLFSAPCMSDRDTHSSESTEGRRSCLRTILQALKTIYRVYFHTDMYDYLHREAQYRGMSFDAKTNKGRTKKR